MNTVLVIDDDPEQVDELRLAFEGEGYYVLTANDGAAGFVFASRKVPDLIITDWAMPVMNGYEMCNRLKAFPATAHIPVIMISGSERDSAGVFDNFFRKPCDLKVLAYVAERIVAHRNQYRTGQSRHAPLPNARWAGIDTRCWP
ncbi:response regulator [Paraburkholderia azotifigens]|uniref:response regulator n=1 Tax=Paraburkholderia azotifigens TaxID=2057004 RepID=UPI00316C7200